MKSLNGMSTFAARHEQIDIKPLGLRHGMKAADLYLRACQPRWGREPRSRDVGFGLGLLRLLLSSCVKVPRPSRWRFNRQCEEILKFIAEHL